MLGPELRRIRLHAVLPAVVHAVLRARLRARLRLRARRRGGRRGGAGLLPADPDDARPLPRRRPALRGSHAGSAALVGRVRAYASQGGNEQQGRGRDPAEQPGKPGRPDRADQHRADDRADPEVSIEQVEHGRAAPPEARREQAVEPVVDAARAETGDQRGGQGHRPLRGDREQARPEGHHRVADDQQPSVTGQRPQQMVDHDADQRPGELRAQGQPGHRRGHAEPGTERGDGRAVQGLERADDHESAAASGDRGDGERAVPAGY